MSAWDIYTLTAEVHGVTRRQAELNKGRRQLLHKMPNSLSYQNIIIDEQERVASIIDSDNLNEKTMFSLPHEDFDCGVIVDWADNKWLITEKDAHTEVYTKVKLLQCNYLLKWVDEEHIIHEQWCVIEDGTKYLTGEYEDRNFVITRGDSRIAMTIGRNEHTAKFGRNSRFIVDDGETQNKMAFLLTKPLKIGHVYNQKGIYSFVLQEVVTTDNDNLELQIADYYKHFSKENSESFIDIGGNHGITGDIDNSGKKVWL